MPITRSHLEEQAMSRPRRVILAISIAAFASLPVAIGANRDSGDTAGGTGPALGATAIEYGLIAASDPASPPTAADSAAPKRLRGSDQEEAGNEMAT
jgi:hypothetical protein